MINELSTATYQRTARIRTAFPTILVGLLAGVAGVAGSYALAGFAPAFVVAPIATFTSQTMPAVVVRLAITTLGELGDQINLATALAIAVVLLTATSLVALVIGRRFRSAAVSTGLTAVFVGTVTVAVTMALIPSMGAGISAGAVVAVGELASVVRTSGDGSVNAGRRAVLGSIASAAGIGVLGYVLGSHRDAASTPTKLDTGAKNGPTADANGTNGTNGGTDGQLGIEELLSLAEERSLDIGGLSGLISGDGFYEVDIYNVNPKLTAEDWTLSITGAVENEVDLTYDEIRKMDAENRFVTLRCVGESLNGHKMDNALWTGVPIMDIIDRANPHGASAVLRDGDGYFEEFPIKALRSGMLAYGKDGSTLPRGHGFPVRALIPGHWGEINVKWLTEIEISEEETTGYWENRGWHGTGPVNTVAKLHAVNYLDSNQIQVGGHAYAGTRGIQKVEVSTDGGGTWNEATLSKSLPEGYGTDVWRQWEYTYDSPGSTHRVVVRATDGEGNIQPKDETNAFPNGPSGWVSRTVNAKS